MNRDYDDYLENECIPIGSNETKGAYIFNQETVDKLLDNLDWYKMWHKTHMAKIEKLQTELETYRPTKLNGNGQCSCYGCEQKKGFNRIWTCFCYKYKGHVYCSDCLKLVLTKEKSKDKLNFAIAELEKVQIELNQDLNPVDIYVLGVIEKHIKDLKEKINW